MNSFTYFPLNHADVHGFLFADGAFVYSNKARAAKALNALSCWLLLQLEEGASESELIQACKLQDASLSLTLLQQEITQLKALQQGQIVTDPAPEFVQTLEQFPLLDLPSPRSGFNVMGLCVCFEQLPEVLRPYLAPVLLHKPLIQSSLVCLLSLQPEGSGFRLLLNNKPWPVLLQATQVAPIVLSIVRRLSAMQQPFFAIAHAGLVDINNQRWLFSGSSGAGKSTLCAQLQAQGQRVLTDEVVLLDNKGCAQAVPLALGLKQNSWPLVQDQLPIEQAIEHERLNGIKVKYLALEGSEQKQKVDAWCFVRFESQQAKPCKLNKMNTFAAVQQLFKNGLELADFSLQNFTELIQIIEKSECYELSFNDSAAAAKYIVEKTTKLFEG